MEHHDVAVAAFVESVVNEPTVFGVQISGALAQNGTGLCECRPVSEHRRRPVAPRNGIEATHVRQQRRHQLRRRVCQTTTDQLAAPIGHPGAFDDERNQVYAHAISIASDQIGKWWVNNPDTSRVCVFSCIFASL